MWVSEMYLHVVLPTEETHTYFCHQAFALRNRDSERLNRHLRLIWRTIPYMCLKKRVAPYHPLHSYSRTIPSYVTTLNRTPFSLMPKSPTALWLTVHHPHHRIPGTLQHLSRVFILLRVQCHTHTQLLVQLSAFQRLNLVKTHL